MCNCTAIVNNIGLRDSFSPKHRDIDFEETEKEYLAKKIQDNNDKDREYWDYSPGYVRHSDRFDDEIASVRNAVGVCPHLTVRTVKKVTFEFVVN